MSFTAKLGALGIAAVAVTAVAGCGSSGGGGGLPAPAATPSWAKSLGSGVTVTAGGASVDDGSPGGVLLGVVQAVQAGDYKKLCTYYPPSEQSDCTSSVAKAKPSDLATSLPTYKSIAVTYTAIKGTEALVGSTGTVCPPDDGGKCVTNSDANAIFDKGKPFSTLWTQASNADSDAYSLAQLAQVSGKWYIYDSSSS